MSSRSASTLLASALMLVAACGDDTPTRVDSGPSPVDGAVDSGQDGGPPPMDGGRDVRTPIDGGTDAGTDAGGDAGSDAGPDVPLDAAPASCEDGVMNGGETAIDCGGGDCEVCEAGEACMANSDCDSRACIVRICRAAACTDGIQNGTESAVDCGGDLCDGCEVGVACGDHDDCESAICAGGVCATANCGDSVINGEETDVDCGGSECPSCAVDDMCVLGRDCASGSCDVTCQAPTCDDGVVNGLETDVDCGGSGACPRCPDFRRCGAASDCLTAMCSMGFCGDDPCIPFGTDTHGNTGCSFTPVTPGCPNIAVTGTPTGLGDNTELLLPIGFNFEFYGNNYTNVTVSANGALVFDTGCVGGACDFTHINSCLPTTAVEYGVFAFWDDLDPGETPGEVYFQSMGTAPNRSFVVQWVTPRNGSGPAVVDFTIVLRETTNEVTVCYNDASTGAAFSDFGASATVGIQGDTDSLQFSCNTADLTDGLLIRYVAP